MSIFHDSEELSKVMVILWEHISANETISKQLVDSKICVQFNYSDPNAVLTLDCSDGLKCNISTGNTTIKPVIQMSMKADIAHDFWMGRVNVPMALLTGKIISRGPTARALKLLPIIKPAFRIYPEVLKKLGKEKLLSK